MEALFWVYLAAVNKNKEDFEIFAATGGFGVGAKTNGSARIQREKWHRGCFGISGEKFEEWNRRAWHGQVWSGV